MSPFGSLIPPQPRVCFRNDRLLPSSASRNVNIFTVLSTSRIFLVVTGVLPLRHSPSMPSPSQCSLCLCRKLHVFSSLPPLEISLRSFSHSLPLFSTACRLFSQNAGVGWASRMLLRDTRGGIPPRERAYRPSPRSVRAAISTFRINTSKSVSKQTTLSSFRINTCEKPRGRGSVS